MRKKTSLEPDAPVGKVDGHLASQTFAYDEIPVLVVGAGGTGSRVLQALAAFDITLRTLRGTGLRVTVVDPDVVSATNVGRQLFFPSDIGLPKAEVLVNRFNLSYGLRWRAECAQLTASSPTVGYRLIIGCVDTRRARYNIMRSVETSLLSGSIYWLDFGNRKSTGQAVLGQISSAKQQVNHPAKLPHVGELWPEMVDPSQDGDDDGPSCSLAQALERQSLMINALTAASGMAMLWKLVNNEKLTHHGVFVNIDTGRTVPLRIDPVLWAKMGYTHERVDLRIAAGTGASANLRRKTNAVMTPAKASMRKAMVMSKALAAEAAAKVTAAAAAASKAGKPPTGSKPTPKAGEDSARAANAAESSSTLGALPPLASLSRSVRVKPTKRAGDVAGGGSASVKSSGSGASKPVDAATARSAGSRKTKASASG